MPSRSSTTWHAALASLAVLGGLVSLLALDVPAWLASRRVSGKLVVFCAAGLKAPIAALAADYQRRFGVEVRIQYGGSQTLLSALEVGPNADLFIPADDAFVALARKKGLIDESLPLASMRPVLAVAKGNPRGYTGLGDLLARGGRVSQANPDAAAVGKVARDALVSSRQWAAFEQLVVVQKPTVNDVAADIQVGAADAAFVWDVTVRTMEGLQAIPAPAIDNLASTLSACVVRSCTRPAEALRFARFLAAPDEGGVTFASEGYTPAGGDPFDDGATPELRLRAGAMLRPALEKTITDFEEREGVRVTRVYNGCGILVTEMKTGQSTDAFFACDREFMGQVGNLFGPPSTISRNQLVILVHKGNPHRIADLKGLASEGLRVGIGHEKQCAMGVLTQRALKEDRSTDAVMKNVKVQSPTGDMLVNQMLTGSLDAVVAYITNAAGHADRLDPIAIDIPCAFADQPFAVGKDSRHARLAGRLLDAIRAEDSRRRFEDAGFTWKLR